MDIVDELDEIERADRFEFGGGGGDRPTAAGGPTQPDRQELIDFLVDLEAELSEVSEYLGAAVPAFAQGLPRLHQNVDLAIAQLQHEAIAGQLAASELRDEPLQMKLLVRNRARRLARAFARRLGGGARKFGLIVVDATKISLKAANVLLGSLLKLPGIEGIKEFKDAAEVALDVVTYLSQADTGDQPPSS
jgi:hypothetical protein